MRLALLRINSYRKEQRRLNCRTCLTQ